MKTLHRIIGALIALYYIDILIAIGLSFFNLPFLVFPRIVLTGLLVGYFALLVVQSYKQDPRRIFPILFLVMIGIMLVFPEYTYLNFFFLITYSFMYSRRSYLSIPLSFIAIGYFILNFLLPVGVLLVTYGWIQYAIKKPA